MRGGGGGDDGQGTPGYGTPNGCVGCVTTSSIGVLTMVILQRVILMVTVLVKIPPVVKSKI